MFKGTPLPHHTSTENSDLVTSDLQFQVDVSGVAWILLPPGGVPLACLHTSCDLLLVALMISEQT